MHDYTSKRAIEAYFTISPDDAPSRAQDHGRALDRRQRACDPVDFGDHPKVGTSLDVPDFKRRAEQYRAGFCIVACGSLRRGGRCGDPFPSCSDTERQQNSYLLATTVGLPAVGLTD